MRLKRHRGLAALLALYLIGGLTLQFVMPAFEGSDEPLHFNYAALLRAEGRLPDRASYLTNPTRQASGQPPLAYAAAAFALALADAPRIDGDALLAHLSGPAANRWYSPHRPWDRWDNHNLYYHGGRDELAFGWPEAVAANRIARAVSLVFGVLGLIGAYGAACEVFRRPGWALTAAAFFAFMPTALFLTAYVTNDAAATAFAALATWGALRIVRRGRSPALLFLTGASLALGGLAKVNVLLIAPGVALALLLRWRADGARPSIWIAEGVVFGSPIAILFGAWALWGALTFNDPFGFATHRYADPTIFTEELRPLAEILARLPHLYLSYWAWFATVPLHPLTYTAFGGLALAALGGWALGIKRLAADRARLAQAAVLALMIAGALAGLLRWMGQLSFTGGRLLYPAHVAFAIGLAGGLALLGWRFPRLDLALRAAATTTLVSAALIFTPLALIEAYWPPALSERAALPALTGGPIDFYAHPDDEKPTLRLLGIAQREPRFTSDWHTLTLCWEIVTETERPAAFSVKLAAHGAIGADRTSVFGMGRLNSVLWRAGDVFCDRVNVPRADPDQPEASPLTAGQVYDIIVVVLDAETQAVDWPAAALNGTRLEAPSVGRVISPAATMIFPDDLMQTQIVFPNFAELAGYRLVGVLPGGAARAGTALTLDLGWRSVAVTPDSWSQFIHLIGAETALVLADGDPLGGSYPTWAWSPGEQLIDRWTLLLPPDLPPGQYALRVGWYRRDTGERMPVMQSGVLSPDGAADLHELLIAAP
ncbi:MAG: glycosyltransferase family 39 protein [Aggregatilineales bacterium]